jgi:hypothetical protein
MVQSRSVFDVVEQVPAAEPAVEAVAVYPVISAPLLLAGAVQVAASAVSAATSVGIPGASATVRGVAAVEISE